MGRVGRSVLIGLLLWGGGATASLEIYKDGAKYRYVPVDDYVGFVRESAALCGERRIELVTRRECPEAKRLCKDRKKIETLEKELRRIREAQTALESWIAAARPAEVDAVKWITAAEKSGKRLAEWRTEELKNEAELKEARERFSKQASAEEARFLPGPCKEQIELTFPSGLIEVQLLNIAELGKQKIGVSRYLSLRNRSGVEISSKNARIYARDFRRTLRPIHFRPWPVRPVAGRTGGAKTEVGDFPGRSEETAKSSHPGMQPTEGGNYAVGRIELPSTGEEIRIPVERYEVPMRCEAISYPWKDPAVYKVCRFTPKSPIESDHWILKKGRRVLSESAFGEYDRGKYQIYVDREDAVAVRRTSLEKGKRSSAIFGTRVRRKDGYSVILDNKSDRQKTVKIIERIPHPTSGRIHVKLISLEGAIQESLDEEGRLVMQTVLAPGEHKEIRVLFEVSYPKELKITY